MAFSSILRRSASSFAPLAAHALRSQQNCHSAIFTALNQTRIVSSEPRLSSFLPPPRSYSTKRTLLRELYTKRNLLREISIEISCAKHAVKYSRVGEAPGGFPFKIEDDSRFRNITLSREYQGEQINVEVERVTREEGGDDNQDYDDDEANPSSISLVVSLAKGNGQFIEFHCTAYPDKILIVRLAAKNPEVSEEEFTYKWPVPLDLDENQWKAFHEYLEIIGITPSTINFLHEYMINRDSRKYLKGLRLLKKFVEA